MKLTYHYKLYKFIKVGHYTAYWALELFHYSSPKSLIQTVLFPSLLQHIRERFLKPGSPYEFPKETFKGWKLDINAMDLEELYDVQPKVLEPLLNYW